MFNYNHLYYFYTAAKFRSITNASDFLSISQPSLSAQIKALEDSLGVELFTRKGRNVELTHKGEVIFQICEDMFRGTVAINNLLKNNQHQNESINIGVSNQIERPYIADVIGTLITNLKKQPCPLIRMTNIERNETALEKFDLLINHKKETLKSNKVINLSFPVALIGSKKLLKPNGSSIKSLHSFLKHYSGGVILPTEDFNLRKETESFLSRENISGKIVFESDNMAANIRAVVEGIGIGFFPLNYVAKEINNKKIDYYMPNNGLWGHHIFLHFNEKKSQGTAIEQLVNLFIHSTHNLIK